MKKYLFPLVIITALFSSSAFAINFDKIAGAVQDATSSDKDGSKNKNNPFGKVDEIAGRIDQRIQKYEKKFDEYEQKMDKAGQALDRVTTTVNGLDQEQIGKYLKIAKVAAIGFVLVFVASFILLIVIFVQLMRIGCELKRLKK